MTLPLLVALCACTDRNAAPPGPAAQPSAQQPATTPPPRQPAPPMPAAAPADPATAPADGRVPLRFQGRYAGDAAACTRPGEETALEIAAQRIAFHESSGSVVTARTSGDDLAIDARMQGEGEQWERTYRFRLEGGDDLLVDAESGLRRVRCAAG